MSIPEEARELAAHHRQQEDHVQQTMLKRSEAELERPANPQLQEEARDLTTEERQHQDHLQQTLRQRALEQ